MCAPLKTEEEEHTCTELKVPSKVLYLRYTVAVDYIGLSWVLAI